MKLLRIPTIQCRADEAGAQPYDMEWRGRLFQVLAHSEAGAREWWSDLAESEREHALGIRSSGGDEPGLF